MKKHAFVAGVLTLAVGLAVFTRVPAVASYVIQTAYRIVQNNGTPLTARQVMNFTGTNVATDTGGVTTINSSITSAANNLIERDANQNAFANNFVSKATNVVSAGGTTTLTAASTRLQNLTGTMVQTFTLPDATTLTVGSTWYFNNNSTGALTVNANGGGLVTTVAAGSQAYVVAIAVSTAAGSWDVHFLLPLGCSVGTIPADATKFLNGTCAFTAPIANTITSGAIASLPASSATAGNMYICTDSPYTFIWNGSSWDSYAFGYKLTQPVLGSFTALNAGTTDTTHGGIIASATRGAANAAWYYVSIPAGASYTDIAFTMSGVDTGPNGSFALIIQAAAATTNACRYYGLGSLGSSVQTQQFEVSTTNCATAAAFASSNINLVSVAAGPLYWMRFYDDGTTNRQVFVSTNPYVWNQVVSEARTLQFTATVVGFAVNDFQLPQSVHILHWKQCTGAPSASCY